MIINRVIEIDSQDPIIQNLARVTDFLGLTDMVEIVLTAQQLLELNNQKVAFLVTEETAWDVVRMMVSATALNLACWKHQDYEVEFAITGTKQVMGFHRNNLIEKHREDGERYLGQASEIFQKYFPTEGFSFWKTPAE